MENAGYKIVLMEEYNEQEHLGIALAERPSSFETDDGKQYATWGYIKDGDRYSFFWGHYILHKDAAYEDYHDRLMTEYKLRRERMEA